MTPAVACASLAAHALSATAADTDNAPAVQAQARLQMPRGPKGENRPADVIGAAIRVARIATGEETEEPAPERSAAAELGSKGGRARAKTLTKKRRSEIAKQAASKRWGR